MGDKLDSRFFCDTEAGTASNVTFGLTAWTRIESLYGSLGILSDIAKKQPSCQIPVAGCFYRIM